MTTHLEAAAIAAAYLLINHPTDSPKARAIATTQVKLARPHITEHVREQMITDALADPDAPPAMIAWLRDWKP